jgi:hypothetical protein
MDQEREKRLTILLALLAVLLLAGLVPLYIRVFGIL